jgi:hypothetical protein
MDVNGNVTITEKLVTETFSKIKGQYGFPYETLKDEQVKVITALLTKKGAVFAVLPTGFGKSDCFALPPLMLQAPVGILCSELFCPHVSENKGNKGAGTKDMERKAGHITTGRFYVR